MHFLPWPERLADRRPSHCAVATLLVPVGDTKSRSRRGCPIRPRRWYSHPQPNTRGLNMAKGQLKQGNSNKPKLTVKEKKEKKKAKAEPKSGLKLGD